MTNEEIKVRFLQAKDKRQQVSILADLNACSKEKIVDILRAMKVDGRLLRYLDNFEPAAKKRVSAAENTETAKASASEQAVSDEPEKSVPLNSALAVIKAEINDINRQQYELDMRKADLHQKIWDMLGEI